MEGKICLITGASAGIGYCTALRMAQLGATIVIASKNEQRGLEAKKNIMLASNNENVEFLPVNLSSMNSIKKFADHFKSMHDSLDVLINNAGVYYSKLTFTEDKIEMQFAVNHLAPFLLTNLLMEPLQRVKGSRIINVSSRFHFQGRMHFDDLSLTTNYHGLRAYCQSKLAMLLFTYKLAEKIKDSGTTANCLHPGTAKTNIGNTNATGFYPVLCKIISPVLVSAQRASRTSVFLASSQELNGVNGKYFQSRRAVRSSKASYNEKDADLLWERSEELTGMKFL